MRKPSKRTRARAAEVFREFAWRVAGALTPPGESATRKPRRRRKKAASAR